MSDFDHQDLEPTGRNDEVRSALLKFVAFAAGIALFVVIGTVVVVKSLDLNAPEHPVGGVSPVTPIAPLPSSALPSDDGPTDEPTDEPTEPEEPTSTPTPTANGDDSLVLSASPVFVSAMERINLAGEWAGRDNVSLSVQRFEDGEWVDFGVQVQVKIGSFATYVLTGREGENKFRVHDPATDTASNEIIVTVE